MIFESRSPPNPRITRVGRVLRKYRVEELPQIINILLGQMRWIGPRPGPEILTRWFVKEVAYYRYRHVVKPGISGWAQVNLGYVGGVDGINTKLQYDFSYIKYFFALARPSCCGRSRRC